jgi:phytanoyl-CoA hydroxylase
MNTTLTADQIAAYQRDGFVSHRGLLTSDEVAELKEAVLATVAAMGKQKVAGGRDWEEGDSYYDKVFTQRLNLHRLSPTVKRYMLASGIGKMIRQLESHGYRIYLDQALIKEPFGNPTAWHLDNPYWAFNSRHSISVWIALEDATLENGCMYMMPGSNRLADFETPGIGANLADLFKRYPKMAEIDPIPCPMKAGDCSFHNGLTAHGAGANMTRKRRIAMTAAFMPIGSTFNGKQDILPTKYFETLKIGDVLDNDDWNPVVG